MLEQVIDALQCPMCGSVLRLQPGAVRCTSNHSFDIARQGYVNLLAGGAPPGTADTAEMVQARATFLESGHYRALTARIAERAAACVEDGLVLDAGAGTGHYLRAVLERVPGSRGLAMDVSKFALRRAARCHERVGAIVWDVWRPLPLRSGSVSLVVNVFAPRNGTEFRRVLRPGGALLVVTPAPRHLGELIARLGLLTVDERKGERLGDALSPYFIEEACEEVQFELRLSRTEAELLARMGPSAHHLDPSALRQRIGALDEPVRATAAFTLTVFRPRA